MSPVTPASDASPEITGTASSDTATVKFYTSSACSTQIGSDTKAAFEGAGVTLTITANTAVTVYAKALDTVGNASACTSMTTYTHDNLAPAAPGFTSASTSPGTSTSPVVRGTSSTDTVTIKLYDGNTCASEIGSGTKALFAGAGVTATVGANATTTIYAQSLDAAGNSSACTSMASYTHDNLVPADPTFTSIAPTSPGTSATPALGVPRPLIQ